MCGEGATVNVVDLFLRQARDRTDRRAMLIPTAWTRHAVTSREDLTYADFARRAAQMKEGIRTAGFGQADRFVLMFPFCTDLYATVEIGRAHV